jgi:hypothetical protein
LPSFEDLQNADLLVRWFSFSAPFLSLISPASYVQSGPKFKPISGAKQLDDTQVMTQSCYGAHPHLPHTGRHLGGETDR